MATETTAALVACGITLAIFIPYLGRVRSGQIRPRPASWLVWASSTILVSGGQALAGAGIGAVPILLSGLLSGAVAILALRRARQRPDLPASTTGDRWCLIIALACLPLWALTGDPLWSVLILTGIDLVGFIPTLRAVWRAPHQESPLLFLAFAVRNAIAIVALASHNLTTTVFPAVIGAACLLTALVVLARRQVASDIPRTPGTTP
jgi:hypothetical protein